MSQVVERSDTGAGQVPYYDEYNDMPKMDDNQGEENVDRTAIIFEVLLDIVIPESSLLGSLPELRGYPRGQLGL